jgi:hypothetical protein
MKTFKENKDYLTINGVYKGAISTDYTNKRIYITIPYGALNNSGQTKVYKVPHKLNLDRIVKHWFKNVDREKVFTY